MFLSTTVLIAGLKCSVLLVHTLLITMVRNTWYHRGPAYKGRLGSDIKIKCPLYSNPQLKYFSAYE